MSKKSRQEVLIELNNYILIHGTVDNITKNKIGEKIYRYFQKNKELIEDAIEELGYELDKVKTYKTKGYYDDFNKVKILLEKFIELNNRFPIKLEIINDLGIGQRYIDKFGGMNELKRKMNYTSNDLIDLRGDFNCSIQELQVANFLCMQGLKDKYKREQHPFPKSEGRYRSDFMFDLDDNKKLHIEVWGYDTNTNSNYDEADIQKAQQLISNMDKNNLIIKSCSICGKTITVNSIDIIMCDNCKNRYNNSNTSYSLINKSKYTEIEYDNNFNILTDKSFKLTTKGFNEHSNIKIKSYIKYFNLHNWLNVIKYYNKFDDLYNYIKEEYLNFYNSTKSQNLSKFCKQHNYIVHELLLEIGTEKIMNDCGFSKQKQFSKDDLKNNFINIVKSIGYIPKYTEFANLTNIHINIYTKYFNLKGKVYDNVVKLYSTEDEFNKYISKNSQTYEINTNNMDIKEVI